MSHGKQFTLFTHAISPNGWKVAFVLNVLGLTYQSRYLDWFTEVRGPEHMKLNPNGRLPTLIDHNNNDFIIWESNAILLYLIEKYDPEHSISVTAADEKATMIQWLFFQSSGQGLYYGQATWVANWHPEKVPSAILRYRNEARRILNVLESVLSKQEWLVGGKLTIAGLAFVPWNSDLHIFLEADFSFEKEFPSTYAWHNKLRNVEGVKNGYVEHDHQLALEEERKTAKAAAQVNRN